VTCVDQALAALKSDGTVPGSAPTGGLTAGWEALVTVVPWLARAIGAALPIAAACALAGYLGHRGLRGRRWPRRGAKPRGA